MSLSVQEQERVQEVITMTAAGASTVFVGSEFKALAAANTVLLLNESI